MCFDYDEFYDKSEINYPKARKEHVCCECGRMIDRGERVLSFSGLLDRRWHVLRVCGECELLRKLIHDFEVSHGCEEYESWCAYGDMREQLRHSEEYAAIPRPTKDAGQEFLGGKRAELDDWKQQRQAAATA